MSDGGTDGECSIYDSRQEVEFADAIAVNDAVDGMDGAALLRAIDADAEEGPHDNDYVKKHNLYDVFDQQPLDGNEGVLSIACTICLVLLIPPVPYSWV